MFASMKFKETPEAEERLDPRERYLTLVASPAHQHDRFQDPEKSPQFLHGRQGKHSDCKY